MRVYKIHLFKGANPFYELRLEDVSSQIEDYLRTGSIYDVISIEILEMAEEEYSLLPDSVGLLNGGE